jgi:hypothetical protein
MSKLEKGESYPGLEIIGAGSSRQQCKTVTAVIRVSRSGTNALNRSPDSG